MKKRRESNTEYKRLSIQGKTSKEVDRKIYETIRDSIFSILKML